MKTGVFLAAAIIALAVVAAFMFFRGLRKAEEAALAETPASPELLELLRSIEDGKEDDDLDDDDWNPGLEYVPSNPRPISATLRLTYCDASGSTTERLVDVRECDTANPSGYLIGFCHLRQSIRTFRLDRVKRAVDAETGELIASLTNYASRMYTESPVASLESLFKDSTDALRGLFFIAKADGRFTKKEKEIFLSFCHQSSGDARISMKQIERACSELPVPSMQAYKLICGRLSKLPDNQRKVIVDTAEAMVATERTIAAQEAEALAYLKKRLLPEAV